MKDPIAKFLEEGTIRTKIPKDISPRIWYDETKKVYMIDGQKMIPLDKVKEIAKNAYNEGALCGDTKDFNKHNWFNFWQGISKEL